MMPSHRSTKGSLSGSTRRSPLHSVVVWYGSMLAFALMAGSMDWKMHRHLESMSDSMQDALRMSVFDLMEQLEIHDLEIQAEREEYRAHSYKEKAAILDNKSDNEHGFANKARTRGDYLAKVAAMEEEESQTTLEKAQRNEELREQVLGNLTLEEQEHEETLNKLRSVHQGICNYTLFGKVCDTVGGVTGLQQKSKSEALRIQSELIQVSTLDREEKLQEIVSKMLQGKSQEYSNTASDLLHVADLWDQHAQKEYELSQVVNATASVLENDAAALEQAEEEVEEEVVETNLEIYMLMHSAQLDHINAYWCAMVAIIFAFCGLVFFVRMAAPRAASFLEECFDVDPAAQQQQQEELLHSMRNASYCGLHVMFFMAVVGMTGDYFEHIGQYSVGQRTVVVVWFAFLGTVFQTFFLHAIPRFLVEVRAQVPELKSFCIYLITKGLVLFFVFSLEVLFAWLSVGPTLFSPALVNIFNTLPYCFFTVLLSMISAFYFDSNLPSDSTESVTVWRCPDEQSTLLSNAQKSFQSGVFSEVTPLYKDEILSHGTILDLDRGRGARTTVSLASSTASHVQALRDEFQQLVLPFEVLIIASMVAVLRSCLDTVWHSQATLLQGSIFICAFILVLLGGVLVKDLTCEECCEPSSSRKSQRNGPDALELVQV
mmetsp:Transcript_16197/g.21189  ORF Transcript_16197/g.21189 Transcript_16197/m.21189 type:complete len:659 (+) Transcript_16197:95-2071(+)